MPATSGRYAAPAARTGPVARRDPREPRELHEEHGERKSPRQSQLDAEPVQVGDGVGAVGDADEVARALRATLRLRVEEERGQQPEHDHAAAVRDRDHAALEPRREPAARIRERRVRDERRARERRSRGRS